MPTKEDKYKLEIENAWQAFYDNKFEKAQAICDSLKEKYPEKVGPFYLQGHIFFEQKLHEKSLEQFFLALKNDVDENASGFIHNYIGKIYDDYGLWDSKNPIRDEMKAILHFSTAMEYSSYPVETIYSLRYKYKNDVERIKLFLDGIYKFPEEITFYILLSGEYAKNKDYSQAITTLINAIEQKQFKSVSLYYNLGQLYFYVSDFSAGRGAFLEALKLNNEKEGINNYAIYYSIGDTYFFEEDYPNANKFYKKSYLESQKTDNCWLGFLGCADVFQKTNDSEIIIELTSRFLIDRLIFFEVELYSGCCPVCFDSNDYDEIKYFHDLKSIYAFLKTLKSLLKKEILGKYWLIMAMLAKHLNKNLERLKALRNAVVLLNVYKYDFVLSELASTYSIVLCEKYEKINNADTVIKNLISDIDNYTTSFSKNFVETSIVETLFKMEKYDEVIRLCTLLNKEELINSNLLFELAYSYNEKGNFAKAKDLYQTYLNQKGESSAVLNNFANIIKKEGNLEQAIEMYKRAIELDKEDEIVKNNLKNTQQQLNIKNQEEHEKQQQVELFKNAEAKLSQENDFVLDKLTIFIENAKQDKDFKSWILPIPQWKFAALMKTDKQKAHSLKEQWLIKNYIIEHSKNELSVTVYHINPFIEKAITRIQRNRLPDKWIIGFSKLNIDQLDSVGYFEITERISKINKKYKLLISRDYDELVFNYLISNEKSTIVLAGSLVELALMYFLEKKKHKIISYKNLNGGNIIKPLYDCVLNDLIIFVKQEKLFDVDFHHLSDLSRIYRNYVHPGKELKGSVDKSKCDLCFISTTEILKLIL